MHKPLSIFDIFKIGVGPSSSHTLGPWKAALDFINLLSNKSFNRVQVELYGSLSKTGKGHCTDIAIMLGLLGYLPDQIDTRLINGLINDIYIYLSMKVNDKIIPFNPSENIIFNSSTQKEHPNTMIIKAFNDLNLVLEQVYHSVGGGFIEKPNEINITQQSNLQLPFPITFAAELLEYTHKNECSISEIVMKNELAFDSKSNIESKLQLIIDTMIQGVYRGIVTEGILPGGLNVKRRAHALAKELLQDRSLNSVKEWMNNVRKTPPSFQAVNKWVSCFALAINEENADLGRVVTSPTNGAAGVIPAVMLYYFFFCQNKNEYHELHKFLKVAGEIGCLFKKNATISAAVGGCQAEIGVSSAMAAGGLTEVLGGTPQQVLMAAEIAMEHHLGLTCDPIGGLVQIPCIERNTMGAIKAITASNLALSSNPDDAKVHLDIVIKTMWQTAQEMNSKYKETSEGGLAYQLPVAIAEC